MREIILQAITAYGYLGVFLLILAENLFPPIPSEVILSFAGFAVRQAQLSFGIMLTAATAGSVLGAVILYACGKWIADKSANNKMANKLLAFLNTDQNDIERAKQSFIKKGQISVLLCRFAPIVRSLISIPAGMAHMKILPFIALTSLGSALWNTALMLLGYAAGEGLTAAMASLNGVLEIAKILVVIIVFCILIKILLKNKNNFCKKQ